MRKFYNAERQRHLELIAKSFFGKDKGNGFFKGKQYPFVLRNGGNNLYEPILEDAIQYFKENNISWWGGTTPTGHVLSSQIACLNHLFAIRKDPEAVLALINGICNKFKKVLPLKCDKDKGYIAFEAVSDNDHLNEDGPTRGSNCTSVDALILAVDNNDENWLIPIEWKYTESYDDYPSSDKSAGEKGKVRMNRYTDLINNSKQLKSLPAYNGSVYYFEPFYQLMRQTLWAEQMLSNKESECVKADHYMHIHVIPSADVDLLNKTYRVSSKNMEKTWRSMLADQSKYLIIDPSVLMKPIENSYPDLCKYLSERYWTR